MVIGLLRRRTARSSQKCGRRLTQRIYAATLSSDAFLYLRSVSAVRGRSFLWGGYHRWIGKRSRTPHTPARPRIFSAPAALGRTTSAAPRAKSVNVNPPGSVCRAVEGAERAIASSQRPSSSLTLRDMLRTLMSNANLVLGNVAAVNRAGFERSQRCPSA